MQAAVGVAQLKKLPAFIERRRRNFSRLHNALLPVRDKLILPEACPGSKPSWFGFLITCRHGVERSRLVRELEGKGIQTRMLFAGNLVKQPAFDDMRGSGIGYRQIGDLAVTDEIMSRTFWVGVYPGMTDGMIDYMGRVITGCVL